MLPSQNALNIVQQDRFEKCRSWPINWELTVITRCSMPDRLAIDLARISSWMSQQRTSLLPSKRLTQAITARHGAGVLKRQMHGTGANRATWGQSSTKALWVVQSHSTLLIRWLVHLQWWSSIRHFRTIKYPIVTRQAALTTHSTMSSQRAWRVPPTMDPRHHNGNDDPVSTPSLH